MKKFLQYLFLIILLTAAGVFFTNRKLVDDAYQHARSYISLPCAGPIKYSIGEVDPRFGISQDEFSADISYAESAWETAAGKNLFQYDPGAKFRINLVFDEREQQTIESQKLEENLSKLKTAHDSTVSKYQTLNAQLSKKLASYNEQVSEYEKRLDDYNAEVEKWNSRGGAPEDKFKELKEEKGDLVDMKNELDRARKEINSLAAKTNNVVEQENQIADTYNTSLDNYTDKYGTTREFEKGVFDGKEINIYEFKEKEDLELTLIHELGHAIGIGHLENPLSAMYYLIGEQDLEHPHLTDEDVAALKGVCRMK